mgnify:CR=1 FL=1
MGLLTVPFGHGDLQEICQLFLDTSDHQQSVLVGFSLLNYFYHFCHHCTLSLTDSAKRLKGDIVTEVVVVVLTFKSYLSNHRF